MWTPSNVNPLIFREQPKVNGLNRKESGPSVPQEELMEEQLTVSGAPKRALMND
jgi:hypothetical protein